MSIIDFFTRVIDRFQYVGNDEISIFGMEGEEEAKQRIRETLNDKIVYYNRIVSSSVNGVKRIFEIDAIILSDKNIFSVEFKRYKGRIRYARKGEIRGDDLNTGHNFSRDSEVDKTFIVKEKEGNYGEDVFTKVFYNPMIKNKNFIYHMKQYLSTYDKRIKKLYIIPVVCFIDSEDIEIEDIYSFEDGMIYLGDLKEFIKQKDSNISNGGNMGEWVVEVINRMPTWDIVKTRSKETMYGVIEGGIKCEMEGKIFTMQINGVRQIDIDNNGFFSTTSKMKVYRKDNSYWEYKINRGEFVLSSGSNKKNIKIVNCERIDIGSTGIMMDV